MKGADEIEKWWQMKQRRKEMRLIKRERTSEEKENCIRFPDEKISTEKLK